VDFLVVVVVVVVEDSCGHERESRFAFKGEPTWLGWAEATPRASCPRARLRFRFATQ
jgi:hypothetical protein